MDFSNHDIDVYLDLGHSESENDHPGHRPNLATDSKFLPEDISQQS